MKVATLSGCESIGTWLDLSVSVVALIFLAMVRSSYFVLQQAKAESLLFQTAEQRYLGLLAQFSGITNRVSLGHIASCLGIQGPSLSRVRAPLGKGK